MKKIIGQIRQIQEKQTFNSGKENEFNKIVCIVETTETQTPIRVEFNNKNIELIQDCLIGQYVVLDVVLVGNYDKNDNSKVYNTFIVNGLIVIQE